MMLVSAWPFFLPLFRVGSAPEGGPTLYRFSYFLTGFLSGLLSLVLAALVGVTIFLMSDTAVRRSEFSGDYLKEGFTVFFGLIMGPIVVGAAGEIAKIIAKKLRW